MTVDPASLLLGTGFNRFTTRFGVGGLCKVHPSGYYLEILAVYSDTPGKGQFRNFMTACKQKYDSITVWEIHSPVLVVILAKYGFVVHWGDIAGENVPGMIWLKDDSMP